MASIFLSHNEADKEFARRLYNDLSGSDIKVWFDEAEIKPGDSLIKKIEDGIDEMDYLGVLLSPHSVSSRWVMEELRAATYEQIEKKFFSIIPLLIEDCKIPLFLKEKKWIDFRDRSEQSYNKGLHELKNLLENAKYQIPISEREQIIDRVKSISVKARIFHKDFSKEAILLILKSLTDMQFEAVCNLIVSYYNGSIGIVKSLALKQIGGLNHESRKIFDNLVQMGFLSISNDPRERDHPDPGFDYEALFFDFKLLLHALEFRSLKLDGILDSRYYLTEETDHSWEELARMKAQKSIKKIMKDFEKVSQNNKLNNSDKSG